MNSINTHVILTSHEGLQDQATANEALQTMLLKTWNTHHETFCKLFVANTQVSGGALCVFTQETRVLKTPLRQLQVLDLSNTNASTTLFHNLHQFPNLETVVLNNCKKMNLEGLPCENDEILLPKKMHTLSLVGTKVSSMCLYHLLTLVPSLETVQCTLDLKGMGKQVVVLTKAKNHWNATTQGRDCSHLISQDEQFYYTVNPMTPYQFLENALKRQGNL